MRRIRTEQRQRMLFRTPLKIPKWEQLTPDEKEKVISRLAVMLQQHRAAIIRDGKEAGDE